MPGKVMTHHALNIIDRPMAIMAPHSGIGGWAPSPRKLKPAASKMAEPNPREAWTIMGAMQLGKTVLKRMRRFLAPTALAAKT